jgi:hypothetical protein
MTCHQIGVCHKKEDLCNASPLKKNLLAACSKTLRYKAPEIPACGRQAEE